MQKTISLFVMLSALATSALAADAPADPARQTSWGLYLDAREAFEMKTREGGKVLFVDVRDPVEIMFTGFTDVVDVNVPLMTVDRTRWDDKRPTYKLVNNAGFEAGIAAALAERGLDKRTPVILMCRSGGERGAPSAKQLEGKGYQSVYVVVDGFEGDTVKTGERKNWRMVNGWKNANLPWSYKLDTSKMYMPKP